MNFRIDWIEIKSPDWKVATLISPDGTKTENVSINKTSKKGDVFPNFDAITVGGDVEGEMWLSNANKWYLFAPKTPKQGNTGGFKANMEKVMEKKQEGIKESQENKEHGIKVSSTIRMAVDLAIASKPQFPPSSGVTLSDISTEEIRKWRAWLWAEWDKEDKDFPPFND